MTAITVSPRQGDVRYDMSDSAARTPSYPVAAIDNTLRTLQLLNSMAEVRVIDVANHLAVARSTAHRILTMLTYHGFAEQDQAKKYHLCTQRALPGGEHTRELVARAHPALLKAAEATGHTVHIVILEGNGARFLHGVVPRGSSRLDSRTGLLYPAHLTAGGRALLAELSVQELRSLFPSRISGRGIPALDYHVLGGVLESVRRRGYAINEGENESGVNAVGLCIKHPGISHPAGAAALVAAASSQLLPRSSFAGVAAALERSAALFESGH